MYCTSYPVLQQVCPVTSATTPPPIRWSGGSFPFGLLPIHRRSLIGRVARPEQRRAWLGGSADWNTNLR